jgi:hypothetical protein
MRWLACLPTLLTLGASAAELPMPEVPDAVGLGPRLALIDALRAEGAKVPESADLEQLKALYWSRHGGVPGAVVEPELGAVDEAALERDRVHRLREELARRHVPAPADADEAKLAALLRESRERERSDAQVAGARAADAERHGGAAEAEGAGNEPATAEPAADPKTEPRGAWKQRVAALLAKLDPRPLDAPPIFPWGERPLPTGDGKGRVRVLHDGGREELLEALPADDHGIASLWELHDLSVQRTVIDGSGTHTLANEWVPLFFVANAGWVQDPDAKRRAIEEDLFADWFDTLLSGADPGGGSDGGAMERIRQAREEAVAIDDRLAHARVLAQDPRFDEAGHERYRVEAAAHEQDLAAAMADFERQVSVRAAVLGLPAAPLLDSERATLRIRELQELAEHLAVFAQLARDEAKRKPDAALADRADALMRDWEARMPEIARCMKQRRAAMAAATPAP